MENATGSGRAWIIGAGASASFGAPTIDQLLDACLQQDTKFRHRELLPKVLNYLYPSVRKRGNIEEFMSLLDTWIQMNDIRNSPIIPTSSLIQKFRRSAEVGRVPIPDQVMHERKVDHLIDFAEQVIGWDDSIV